MTRANLASFLLLPTLSSIAIAPTSTITATRTFGGGHNSAHGSSTWEGLRVFSAIFNSTAFAWKLDTNAVPTSSSASPATGGPAYRNIRSLNDAAGTASCTSGNGMTGTLVLDFGTEFTFAEGNLLRIWGFESACEVTCVLADGTRRTSQSLRAVRDYWGVSFDVLGMCVGATSLSMRAGGYCGGCQIQAPQRAPNGHYVSDRGSGIWVASVRGRLPDAADARPPWPPSPDVPPAASPPPASPPLPPSLPPPAAPPLAPGNRWRLVHQDHFPQETATWTMQGAFEMYFSPRGNPCVITSF